MLLQFILHDSIQRNSEYTQWYNNAEWYYYVELNGTLLTLGNESIPLVATSQLELVTTQIASRNSSPSSEDLTVKTSTQFKILFRQCLLVLLTRIIHISPTLYTKIVG